MDLMMPGIALAATLAFFGLGRVLRAFPMAANYEGKTIPVAGLAAALGALAGLGSRHVWGMEWRQDLYLAYPIQPRLFWAGAIALLAFAALGYVDDRWGNRSVSGFRGHIRAAVRGHITTGFIKMLGGGLAALFCGWLLRGSADVGNVLWLMIAAVIALSANAFNLLDTRPARAAWMFLAASLAVLLFWPDSIVAAGTGAALAWLPLDRGRKAMLGDAGSNPLGAFWGVSFVAYARWEAVLTALALLIAFHIYAERRSLSADIAAVPLLRRMDEVLRG